MELENFKKLEMSEVFQSYEQDFCKNINEINKISDIINLQSKGILVCSSHTLDKKEAAIQEARSILEEADGCVSTARMIYL